MKKYLILFVLCLVTAGCSIRSPENVESLKKEIAVLQANLEDSKPGLGEIMGVIQQHHEKLYFSGKNENWDLASYELDEIKEGLDQATELHEHFKQVKTSLKDLRHITDQAVHGVANAILEKSESHFISAYKSLSVSCNECHQAADHPFIVIQTPTSPMYSNQNFKIHK
jgi:hypothetical protein